MHPGDFAEIIRDTSRLKQSRLLLGLGKSEEERRTQKAELHGRIKAVLFPDAEASVFCISDISLRLTINASKK